MFITTSSITSKSMSMPTTPTVWLFAYSGMTYDSISTLRFLLKYGAIHVGLPFFTGS